MPTEWLTKRVLDKSPSGFPRVSRIDTKTGRYGIRPSAAASIAAVAAACTACNSASVRSCNNRLPYFGAPFLAAQTAPSENAMARACSIRCLCGMLPPLGWSGAAIGPVEDFIGVARVSGGTIGPVVMVLVGLSFLHRIEQVIKQAHWPREESRGMSHVPNQILNASFTMSIAPITQEMVFGCQQPNTRLAGMLPFEAFTPMHFISIRHVRGGPARLRGHCKLVRPCSPPAPGQAPRAAPF